eukprot:g6435.t1
MSEASGAKSQKGSGNAGSENGSTVDSVGRESGAVAGMHQEGAVSSAKLAAKATADEQVATALATAPPIQSFAEASKESDEKDEIDALNAELSSMVEQKKVLKGQTEAAQPEADKAQQVLRQDSRVVRLGTVARVGSSVVRVDSTVVRAGTMVLVVVRVHRCSGMVDLACGMMDAGDLVHLVAVMDGNREDMEGSEIIVVADIAEAVEDSGFGLAPGDDNVGVREAREQAGRGDVGARCRGPADPHTLNRR